MAEFQGQGHSQGHKSLDEAHNLSKRASALPVRMS